MAKENVIRSEDMYSLLEIIFPPDAPAPAEKYRQVLTRAAFFLSFLSDCERDYQPLFARWATMMEQTPSGAVQWPTEAVGRQFFDEAAHVLGEVGKTWPWMIVSLCRWFLVVVVRVEPRPAPLLPADQLRASLLRVFERSLHPGRFPKNDGARLAVWARWFARARIHGVSVRALAREHHDAEGHARAFDECDCRKAVTYGLREVERLLTPTTPPLGK